MDCLKSCNICVNTLVLPGSIAKSSYSTDEYPNSKETNGLKLLFIPVEDESCSLGCSNFPKYIPALLNIGVLNSASIFCIHFHGNACDIGEVAACALSEGYTFRAHYMIVEYPMFGISKGFPGEAVINSIARSVHRFVTNELKVPSERIVLIGRSIGTGPACSLASYLESKNTPPAALILHAPYTSLKDAAYDLLGCFSYLFLNKWENWTKLCEVKNKNIRKYQKRRAKDTDSTRNINDNNPEVIFSPMSHTHNNPLLSSTLSPSSKASEREILHEKEFQKRDHFHNNNDNNNHDNDDNHNDNKNDNQKENIKNNNHDNNNNNNSENVFNDNNTLNNNNNNNYEYQNPTTHEVIKCPVLFIHADKDLIIDCHHSQMMHNLRIEAGLISVLYIQKSVEGFSKGHNYFDYSKEVVIPCRDFLHKYVLDDIPHSLNIKSVSTACIVPTGYSQSLNFKGYNCASRDEDHINNQKKGNDKDIHNDRNPDMTSNNTKENIQNDKKNRFYGCCRNSYDVSTSCRWMLCPCVFCLESSLSCFLSGMTNCYYFFTNTTPSFKYETKKSRGVDHLNGYKVIKALLCSQSLDNLIKEEGPNDNNDNDDCDNDDDDDEEEEEVHPAFTKNPLIQEMDRSNKITRSKENIRKKINIDINSEDHLSLNNPNRQDSYQRYRKSDKIQSLKI